MTRETVSQTNRATDLMQDVMAPTVTGGLCGVPAGHSKAVGSTETQSAARKSRWGKNTSSEQDGVALLYSMSRACRAYPQVTVFLPLLRSLEGRFSPSHPSPSSSWERL